MAHSSDAVGVDSLDLSCSADYFITYLIKEPMVDLQKTC